MELTGRRNMPVMEGTFRNIIFSFILLFLIFGSTEAQYENKRCKCICPDPQVVIKNNSTIDTNTTATNSSSNRIYISNSVAPDSCNCDSVVLPVITQYFNMQGQQGAFCPRCECRYESRNLGIIKVVVIIVIWVVSLLMIYMLFLMCLDPLLNKRIKSTAYQEHTNEDDDSVGGGRTSHPMRVTGSSEMTTTTVATSLGPSSGVLNRVGHQQSKWKRQVQEQRKNIYDRHTMLN